MTFNENQPYLGKFHYEINDKSYDYTGYVRYINNELFLTLHSHDHAFKSYFYVPKITGFLCNESLHIMLIECTIIRTHNFEITYLVQELHFSSKDIKGISEINKVSFRISGLEYFFEGTMIQDEIDHKNYTKKSTTKAPEKIILFQNSKYSCEVVRHWQLENKRNQNTTYIFSEIVIEATNLVAKHNLLKITNKIRLFFSLISFEQFKFHYLLYSNNDSITQVVTNDYQLNANIEYTSFPYFTKKELTPILSSAIQNFINDEAFYKIVNTILHLRITPNYIDQFLNATKSIELFARAFLYNTENSSHFDKPEERETFMSWSGFKEKELEKDGTLLVYFKAINYLSGTKLYDNIIGNSLFFKSLVDTRNYYTHLHKAPMNLWKPSEIRKYTPHLKSMVHSLIWKKLSLDTQYLDKIYKSQQQFIPEGSPEENKDSIYYNNI